MSTDRESYTAKVRVSENVVHKSPVEHIEIEDEPNKNLR